jgi:hypothetical protein
MPFDPVSIIGYVGTTAGLISFATNTIGKIDKQIRDYQECRRLLWWYRGQMGSIIMTLKSWQMLWCMGSRAYADETYRHWWNDDGLYEISQKLEDIKFENDAIGLLLYPGLAKTISEADQRTLVAPDHYEGTLAVSASVWSHWEKFLRSAESKDLNANWFEKLRFTVLNNLNLEERIQRLRNRVKDLQDYSTEMYWLVQDTIGDPGTILKGDLAKSAIQKEWTDDLVERMEKLHIACRGSGNTWSLVLSMPDEEGGPISIENESDIRFEFDVSRSETSKRQELGGVGIVSVLHSDLNDSMIQTLAYNSFPAKKAISRSGLLRQILFSESTSTSRVRKMSAMDRAITAFGLVNWMMLLWNTPWTFNLCSCGIRYAYLDRERKNWNPIFTSHNTRHVSPHCHDDHIKDRKFLLMAVTLAELGLSKPVGVTVDDDREEVTFTVDGRGTSRRALLQELGRECSDSYRKVVQYCLACNSRSPWKLLRMRDYIAYKENIIDP